MIYGFQWCRKEVYAVCKWLLAHNDGYRMAGVPLTKGTNSRRKTRLNWNVEECMWFYHEGSSPINGEKTHVYTKEEKSLNNDLTRRLHLTCYPSAGYDPGKSFGGTLGDWGPNVKGYRTSRAQNVMQIRPHSLRAYFQNISLERKHFRGRAGASSRLHGRKIWFSIYCTHLNT